MSIKKISRAFCAAGSLLFIFQAMAEPGISTNTILLGRSAGITGTQAEPVQENTAGAQLYFNKVNKQGGIHGRKIVLTTLDDGYDPKNTVENVKQLIEQHKVFALFLIRGTSNNEAALPVFTAAKVPVIAPVATSEIMIEPVNRYVFNIRARASREVEKTVDHLTNLGVKSIAVAYADDGFGKSVMSAVETALKKRNLSASAKVSFDRTASKFDDQVQQIAQAKPQAVILGAVAKPSAAFIKAAKQAKIDAQFFTLSNTSTDSFVKDLGEHGRGISVSQVMPYPWSAGTSLGKEFMQAVKESPGTVISYGSMEGYAAAKVMVEGLKRAGPQPTREKLISALETLSDFDLGGLKIAYSPEDHRGSNFVEITVIGKDGKFMK